MHAVTYRRYGGPEVLSFSEVPTPECGPTQVRINVVAAALNPLDWKLVHGDFRLLRGWRNTRLSGIDFAGRIESVGQRVSDWKPGEAVFGSLANPFSGRQGALAEQVVVSPGEIARKPDRVAFDLACTLPIAGASGLQCLELAGMQAESDILLVGASGGVGSFCLRIGTTAGARITGVCRAENEEYVRGLGASNTIAYDRRDLFSEGRQYDAIIDAAGIHSFRKCAPLLKPRGTYVHTVPGPALFLAMLRSRLFGGKQARGLMLKRSSERLNQLATLAESGKLDEIEIHHFPLTDIRNAFQLCRSGHTRGKIVVEIAT